MTVPRQDPRRILLVGGASYFGRHFFEYAKGIFPQSEFVLTSRWSQKGDHWLTLDPSDRDQVAAALSRIRPDCIINFVGATTGSFHRQLRINAVIPLILSRGVAAVSRNSRLVLIGSAAEYGLATRETAFSEDSPRRPGSVYGQTKSAQSSLFSTITELVPDSLLVRVFNLYGKEAPALSVLAQLRNQLGDSTIRTPKTLRSGFLGDHRDFISVHSANASLASLIRHARPGAVHNIGSGVSQQVRRFVCTWLTEHTGMLPNEYEIVEKGKRPPNFSLADMTATNAATGEAPQ